MDGGGSQVFQYIGNKLGFLTTLPAARSSFYMHSLITTWWLVDLVFACVHGAFAAVSRKVQGGVEFLYISS